MSNRLIPVPCHTRSAIWPAAIRAATSTTRTPAAVAISCGKAIPSRRPSARTAANATIARLVERGPGKRGRERVDPAHAEPDAGGPQSIRQGQQGRLAAPHCEEAVQLHTVEVLLEDRLPAAREREHLGQVRSDLGCRLDEEEPALAPGVGRLQDGRRWQRCERRFNILCRSQDA